MDELIKFTIDDLFIGQTATFSKTISEADVYMFAGLTGDFNPVHINKEYAKGTPFKERIAHGIFSAGLISTVIGTQLPGPGTIYLGQELKFVAPVYFGDTITATVSIEKILKDKNIAVMKTVCSNQDGKNVVEGTATILAPKKIGA